MLEITLKSPYQFAHILFQPTIVPHGGHYHFIPESDLSAGELAATYVFNPNDIVRDIGDAYIVRHGDHNHYIKVQTKGYEAALKNKIPSLQSNYQPGTFDEKAVLAKVDQLLADSRSIYKDRLS